MTKATKKPLCVSLLAMALFMMPVASAATWHAELTVESVQAMGTSSTNGRLAVLLQEIVLPADQAGEPAFTLQAERLHLETDHADVATGPPVEHNQDPRTIENDYNDVSVVGVEHRDQYRFLLVPHNRGVTVLSSDSTCASLRPSDAEQVSRDTHVKASRTPLAASAASALWWRGCTTGQVTVQGDFVLQLWNWDSELTTSAGERQYLASGRQSMVPDSTGVGQSVGSADEQFLFAYNATLTTRLSGNYHFYIQDANVEAAAFQLTSATGSLTGPTRLDVEGQDVVVQGDASLHLQGRGVGAPFAAAMDGDVQRLAIDGIAWTTTVQGPTQEFPMWPAMVLAGALAVAVAWTLRRRPRRLYQTTRDMQGDLGSLSATTRQEERGIGYTLLAKRANQRRRHATARRHAQRAARLFPLYPEAALALAIAEGHLRRDKSALRHYMQAFASLAGPHKRATAAIGAAASCCRLGASEAAIDWIKQAWLLDQEFTQRQVDRPVFRDVRDDLFTTSADPPSSHDASFT